MTAFQIILKLFCLSSEPGDYFVDHWTCYQQRVALLTGVVSQKIAKYVFHHYSKQELPQQIFASSTVNLTCQLLSDNADAIIPLYFAEWCLEKSITWIFLDSSRCQSMVEVVKLFPKIIACWQFAVW